MPLLDSFTVDHTRMEAPAVRVAKKMNTPHGDEITVFDLRFCVPNQEVMPERGIHTLEHLFAGFMRDHLNGNGVEMSVEAAGIAVCLIEYSHHACRTECDAMTEHYYRLRDYALQHPESSAILRIID